MPATMTLDELDKALGIQSSTPTFSAPQFSLTDLDRRLGIGKEEPEEETDWSIGKIIKEGFKRTSYGLGAQLAGIVDPSEELGTGGTIAAEILAFVADPVTWGTGGLGGLIGKKAAEKFALQLAKTGAKGFAARAAVKAIQPAVQLGGLQAVKEIPQQILATGEFDPVEGAKHVTQSTVAGAMFGPAGLAPKGLRTVAEVATMAASGPITELRGFTEEDWIDAGGTVGGFKLYRGLSKLAKLGYNKTVSRKEYVDATGAKPGDVPPEQGRKEEADAALAKELKDATDAIPEGDAPPIEG